VGAAGAASKSEMRQAARQQPNSDRGRNVKEDYPCNMSVALNSIQPQREAANEA